MFYRQKIMLALIEFYGGKLSNTDLEKLLFLFCQTTKQNYYDFFPYKYGPFSFTSYHDKRKLTEKGLLKSTENFELVTSTSYIEKLKVKDRATMRNFVSRTLKLRGEDLIRKAYLEYPHYACRSEIAQTLLTQEEYNSISRFWNLDIQQTLFTIGYEGSSIDHYLNRLLMNNISVLIDVRKNPLSRKHGFSRRSLQAYLEKVGVQYYHFPELGITSSLRKGLSGEQSYKELFDYYAATILPEQKPVLDKIKQLLFEKHRVALTCFEAEYRMCHRHKITELFETDTSLAMPIIHI